ncbi:MAG TPA: hypothetical protein VGP93_02940, partial [Polyangiaceae bacterium]|nr:hypothetical protein [Polyangiaceae bacterium]
NERRPFDYRHLEFEPRRVACLFGAWRFGRQLAVAGASRHFAGKGVDLDGDWLFNRRRNLLRWRRCIRNEKHR